MQTPRAVFYLQVLVLSATLGSAQDNPPVPLAQNAATAPTPPVEPMERQVRKTVAFITMHCIEGTQFVKAQGTGFLIEVPDSRLPANRSFMYLVTNRHIAMCW